MTEPIDAHHHLWRYSKEEYGWIGPGMEEIARDFLPGGLESELGACGVSGSVVVQARQTLAETEWLLMLAERSAWIRGVVGWAPIADRHFPADLERLRTSNKLKGLRHIIQAEPDDEFILRQDFNAGIKSLGGSGLVYDILIYDRHLPAAIRFVDRHPNQVFVLDHLAKPRIKEQFFRSTDSQLAGLAVNLVTYVSEIQKPDGERLEGFHDSQLESLRLRLFSPAPIYPEMEIARMTSALEAGVKELGPDDPWIKAVLDGRTPKDAANQMISGTKMGDAAFRKSLAEGGQTAVEASTDPLIAMARRIDPIRREQIKWFEKNVQSVEQRSGEKLGRARFAVYGKNTYPDATFTLRLSYGQVMGYPMNGTKAPYKTTMYGLYDRAASFNNKVPFDLPKRYVDGKDKLDLATPFNFVTTNDIIGGNSGSPVVDRQGNIVGLIFDGNIQSLVGDFVYDSYQNRAVAVHTAAMTEALKKLYGAQKLVDELLGH